MLSYSETIIEFLFGPMHQSAIGYTKNIFLVMLPYPIIQLQASFLIAGGGELYDLWGNILVRFLTISLGLILLQYYEQVKAVFYSLYFSFLGFLAFQDTILMKREKINVLYKILLYGITLTLLLSYHFFIKEINASIAFIILWFMITIGIAILFKNKRLNFSDLKLRA